METHHFSIGLKTLTTRIVYKKGLKHRASPRSNPFLYTIPVVDVGWVVCRVGKVFFLPTYRPLIRQVQRIGEINEYVKYNELAK